MRQEIFSYIKAKYNTDPEYPWRDNNVVFRHKDNRKWFALVMDVQRNKLGFSGDGSVLVMNLKIDDIFFRDMIIREEGIMPAYHMNKLHWITLLLDGTVPQKTIYDLLEMSYMATASSKKKEKIRPPKEWLIPANPKYYDVLHAFDERTEINWKQGAGIRVGDTVFMYVTAPVSAILYKCKVTEVDLPSKHTNPHVNVKMLMRIKLLQKYEPDCFTFAVLKEDFGIYAVRGPRGIPYSLSHALNKNEKDNH